MPLHTHGLQGNISKGSSAARKGRKPEKEVPGEWEELLRDCSGGEVRRKTERPCIAKKIRKKSGLRYLEQFYQMDPQTVF